MMNYGEIIKFLKIRKMFFITFFKKIILFSKKQLEFTGKKIVESEKGIFYKGNYIALYPVSPQKEKAPVEIPDCVKLFKQGE